MKTTRLAAFAAILLLNLSVTGRSSLAQTDPVLKHSFESNESGWMAMGENAKLSVTNTSTNVKVGKGSLQFNYTIEKGSFCAAILPTAPPMLAKMKSIKFWIKTDATTTFIVSLKERNGGQYMAGFSTPKDEWQRVELSSADFNLTEGPNDPKDTDGKLDLDQVENITVADLGQFFAQADAGLVDLFGVKFGAHTAFLDEFEVTEDAVASSTSSSGTAVTLDTFSHPQVAWLAVGGIKLTHTAGKLSSARALQADYKQQPMKIAGIVRSVKRGSLDGMKTLTFSVASAKACKLMVQVEEPGGGKYNTLVDIPGGSVEKQISIPFAEMGAAEDSKDTNGKLDMDQVHQLVIMDVYGLIGMAEGENTLWIGSLRATK